jgi:hypothetical protein
LKSASETIFPSLSGRVNAGAMLFSDIIIG